MPTRFPIHRTRIGRDLIAEFAVPPTEKLRKKGRVALIAKGVPGMPGSAHFLEFLAREGFYAISPRYRGTWESGGVFLKEDPTDDIEEVLNALGKPLISLYEGREYTVPSEPVYVFVASFGGPAGLFLSKDARVERVFAYSPVVDWRVPMPKEPVKGFTKMTKLLYGEAYRIDPKGEAKLLSGTFYNPASAPYEIDGSKVHIFHAKDDDIVSFDPVRAFAKQIGAQLTAYTKGGHGGTSHFMEKRIWKQIMTDLRSFS